MTAKKKIVGEEEEAEELTGARFEISDGKRMLRVAASKDNWLIQKKGLSTDKDTKVVTETWTTFKYVTDIASVAERIFQFRLKNADVTTLLELSAESKKIAAEIRKEFGLQGEKI